MQPQQDAIISTFENLTKTSSRKEKEAILGAAFKSQYAETVKQALRLGNDPYCTFGVVVEEKFTASQEVPTWEVFCDTLTKFSKRELTGNDAKEAAAALAGTNSDIWNRWASRIINKDLRIGAAAKTINKVAGHAFIREFLVPLCDKFDPNEEGAENTRSLFGDNHIIEQKLDGYRCVAHVNGKNVTLYGRSGKTLANTKYVEAELASLGLQDTILDGELMGDNFTTTVKICGSDVAVLEDSLIRKLKFHIFDICDGKRFFSQGKEGKADLTLERKEQLTALSSKFVEFLVLVPWAKFDSRSLAQYEQHLAEGFEGSIIKSTATAYEFGRTSTQWLKVKPILEIDMSVTGFEEGTGKHAGSLGALVTEGTAKGPEGVELAVSAKVGTGLSDDLRAEIWSKRAEYLGKVIEVGYQNLSQDDKTKGWSLRFPRFRKLNDKVLA